MQLANLTNKLKPITLAAGILSATHSFAYSDFDEYSGVLTPASNNKTEEYMLITDKNDSGYFSQKFKFQYHLMNWEKKTIFFSSPKSIIEDADFQAIVSMGFNAVPFIIEELERKQSTLVWALNMIYKSKITSNINATVADACKLWVKHLKG